MKERTLAQQNPGTNDDQFRQIAEGLPQLVWVTDPEGFHQWYNRRWYEYTGTTPDRCIGDGWSGFFHPDDRERASQVWRASLATGQPYNIEYRCRRHDGIYRWFLGSAFPLRDTGGKIIRWFGTCTDIHRQKQAEEALVKSEKLAAVGRLFATIAHEINNPLEAVTNIIWLLRNDATLPPHVCEQLKTADEELARVAHLTKQTLAFHRGSSDTHRLRLSELIENVLAIFAPRFRNKGVKLHRAVNVESAVTGVSGELRQVITNLISNSLDAVAAGGTIWVRVRSAQRGDLKGTIMTVADNGVGIPDSSKMNIFEAFFSTKADVGIGLGLWVTQQIVQKHNGSIRLRSSARPGRSWTVFTIFLPEVTEACASQAVIVGLRR